MASSREVYALVFAYLSKVDASLAKRYQQKTKAEPLVEGAPSLNKVVQHFLRAHKSVKKTKRKRQKRCSTAFKRDSALTPQQRRVTCTDDDSGVDSACSSLSGRTAATDGLPSAAGDEMVRCDQCGRQWEDGNCMLHGPTIAVPDSPVPPATPPAERAACSAPAVLRVGPSGVHRGGLGVWTRRALPAGLRFGPYRGRREPSVARASAGGYSWEVHRRDRLWFCVDAADPARANWMRFVNCAPSAGAENVTAYQHRWRIWYRTCRSIPRNTELLVYYGDEYQRELERDAAGKRRRCEHQGRYRSSV